MNHPQEEKKRLEADKLQRRLLRLSGQAIKDFNMIEDQDLVMVCLSGGKDSHAMLDLLLRHQKVAPISFRIVAVNLDQSQPGFPAHVLPAWFESLGVEYRIVKRDTYSQVKRLVPEGATACSVCSRLRRGNLYATARELGATKIALGHHRDDILATFFLNLFHGGTLKTMPPKLLSDNGEHVVIRPLAYCKESDIEEFARIKAFPIIPCDLCGSQPDLQRRIIKEMLIDWGKKSPHRLDNIFRALSHATPSHLLDPALYNFAGLKADGIDHSGERKGAYKQGKKWAETARDGEDLLSVEALPTDRDLLPERDQPTDGK